MKVRQLKKNEYDRFEMDEWTELRCGDVIEVFIFPNDGEQGKWETVRIEHDGHDYYAVGHKNLCLQGLWARETR